MVTVIPCQWTSTQLKCSLQPTALILDLIKVTFHLACLECWIKVWYRQYSLLHMASRTCSWSLASYRWNIGVCGGAVGWGTALQARRSWVRFLMVSLEFFIDINPSGRTVALGYSQPLTEMSTRSISWGWRRPLCRADNLTTFMCWLSWNLGASTAWNLQALSRALMELLFLLLQMEHVYM